MSQARCRLFMLEPSEAAVGAEEAVLHRILCLVTDEPPRQPVETRKLALGE